ncbi:hypothetical protein IPL85_06245 [Candidatus Saccharibacteria bacterium]|nr:MAG: hypothetical protein IPL85_06245 [Candidatus Saccharibacteria bacterium]
MDSQLALLVGCAIGYWLAYINIDNIFMYARLRRYSGKDPYFDSIFTMLDSEEDFSIHHGVVSGLGYKRFHKIIHGGTVDVNRIFAQSMHDILRFIIISYSVLLLVPSILAVQAAPYYVLGVVLMHISFFYYRYTFSTNSLAYYVYWMQGLIIRKYLDTVNGEESDERQKL